MSSVEFWHLTVHQFAFVLPTGANDELKEDGKPPRGQKGRKSSRKKDRKVHTVNEPDAPFPPSPAQS